MSEDAPAYGSIGASYVERYRALLERMVAQSTEDLDHMAFERASAQHVVLACLYATILQSTKECMLLLTQPTITAPAVIRTIVEAYADFCALIKDPDHVQRMLSTYYGEQKRHLKSMIDNPNNPYHGDVARHIDPVARLADVKALLTEAKGRGHEPMTNADRFRWADQKDIHQVYYWLVCLPSHNSITSLESRHVENHADGRYDLVAVKENTPEQLCGYYDALAGIVADAGQRLHEFLSTTVAPGYAERKEELRRLRVEQFPESGAAGKETPT
jgi:hypothetical protein